MIPSEASETVTATVTIFEDDLNRQMEDAYDRDPDDWDAAPLAKAFPNPTLVETEVPVQDSPTLLPELWPRLLGEFISARPLIGSHLLKTRLEWEDGETPALHLIFLQKNDYSLIGEDADFRKTIQGFLASKLTGSTRLTFRFSMEEAAASESKETVQVLFGSDDPMQLPIVGYIRDLFAARPIN